MLIIRVPHKSYGFYSVIWTACKKRTISMKLFVDFAPSTGMPIPYTFYASGIISSLSI